MGEQYMACICKKNREEWVTKGKWVEWMICVLKNSGKKMDCFL
jgi:hypothetical protein